MIKETLKKLNFNDKEVQIYLLCLQHGKLTPSAISKMANINRTTVYSVAKELIKKGVLQEDLGGANRAFLALPPQTFESNWKKEERKLQDKKLAVMRAVSELGAYTRGSKYSVPKILFIEEEGVEDHLYKQTSIWNRSLKEKEVDYWGFQDPSFIEYYEEWIDWYWTQEKSSNDISLKLLSTKEAETLKGKKYKNRQIRFWNKAKNITATTWIMGDHVVMIITNKRPHYLVEIVDEVLADNMRQIFKSMWEEVIIAKK
jgi:sugar-specific transcriptional regulator TrmB